MQNIIKKYQSLAEQAFGVLRFENEKPQTGTKVGRPIKRLYLYDLMWTGLGNSHCQPPYL